MKRKTMLAIVSESPVATVVGDFRRPSCRPTQGAADSDELGPHSGREVVLGSFGVNGARRGVISSVICVMHSLKYLMSPGRPLRRIHRGPPRQR